MDRQNTSGPLLENSPAAFYRAGRLRIKKANLCWGYILDLFAGVVLPSALGAGLAAISVLVLQNVEGSEDWIRANLYSEQVLSSLGTMIVFLVTLRLGANLSRNGAIVGHFGNLCGGCVNLAIWSRSLVTSGKLETIQYPNGNGKSYRTTEVGLILASIPYTVKYSYRNVKVKLDQLPIGASPSLVARAITLTTSVDGYVAVSPFMAMIMILGEKYDDLEAAGLIKTPELSLIFNQLNAVTGEEGSIGGTQGYSLPGILNFLLYVIFLVYYVLLILCDLGVNNQWQSLWIVAVLIVTNFGIWQISERYANPFNVSVKSSTQKPLISEAARGTEIAIDGVFGRKRGGVVTSGAGAVTTTGLSIGLGMGL